MGINKGIQLDLSKRKLLQLHLYEGKKAFEIAHILNVHKSTISRELFKHRYLTFKGDEALSICSHCQKAPTCKLHNAPLPE